ncbi:MAG: ribosome maturation factor RimM [Rudaea sp.]
MGRVASPHGVRGAVKVRPESAEPTALSAYAQWWLRTKDGTWTPYRVRDVREQSGMLVARFAQVDSREAASLLRGAEVGVPREMLPPPARDEHYQADLIGMAVVNREGAMLGAVAGFADSGAHPIVRVAGPAGVERLIPWVPQYVSGVDVAARRIDVDWPLDY